MTTEENICNTSNALYELWVSLVLVYTVRILDSDCRCLF